MTRDHVRDVLQRTALRHERGYNPEQIESLTDAVLELIAQGWRDGAAAQREAHRAKGCPHACMPPCPWDHQFKSTPLVEPPQQGA